MCGRKTDRLSVLADASGLVSKTGIDPDILVMANNTQQQRNAAVSRLSSNSKSSRHAQNGSASTSSPRMRELATQTIQSYHDEQTAGDQIKPYIPPPSHLSIGAGYSPSSRCHQPCPSTPASLNLDTVLPDCYAAQAGKARRWRAGQNQNQEIEQQLPGTATSDSSPPAEATKPSFHRHYRPTANMSPTPGARRPPSYLGSPRIVNSFANVHNMRMTDSSTAYADADEMVDDDDGTISALSNSRASSRQSYQPSPSAGGSSLSSGSGLGGDGKMDATMSSERWEGKLSRAAAHKGGRW